VTSASTMGESIFDGEPERMMGSPSAVARNTMSVLRTTVMLESYKSHIRLWHPLSSASHMAHAYTKVRTSVQARVTLALFDSGTVCVQVLH
jgi:hypothetical protein